MKWTPTVSVIAIPIVILVLGAIINRSISDAELEADYVAVAVDILSADRPLSEDTVELEADVALRRWAVDVLELNTPVAMSAELKTSLRQGDVTLQPREVIEASSIDRNCADFATQAEAQAWHDVFAPFSDAVARFDSDRDGIACEGLP